MAVALDIRLWFDDCDGAARFGRLVECVSAWPAVDGGPWRRFVVRDSVGGRPLAESPARAGKRRQRSGGAGESPAGLSLPELRRLAAGWGQGHVQLSASTSAHTASTAPATSEPTSIPLTVESWGRGWIDSGAAFGPRSLVGDASVWLHRCRPYLAPSDRAPQALPGVAGPGAQADGHIEQNLDTLTELMLGLVDQLEPASLKLFTDVAPYLPIDAHAAYFRDAAAVVDDLQLLAQAWAHGLPGIDPLRRAGPSHAFHEWRGPTGCQELHAALARAIDHAAAVTPLTVDAVLKSGRFDVHPCRRGVVVLDFPHFVNGFLDGFYLAVLEAAGG